jgi:Uma2 family endonuclease
MNIPLRVTPSSEPFYIDSDGKPMGESQQHILNIRHLLEPLDEWFAAEPKVYIGGNMFVHYERGNRNRHVSPDVFVVRGVPKVVQPPRRNFLVWEEGRAPDFVVEVTSKTTKQEDLVEKRAIYQDRLRVKEYFLFDPYREYLEPPLQGFRRVSGQFRPIKPVDGRLPSKVLGLHLEPHGDLLRLYDPATGRWLPTPPEVLAAKNEEEAARLREAEARRQEAEARRKAEAEVERLQKELEQLRRELGKRP